MDEYINLLKRHDWTYEWSDDGRAYSRGLAEYKSLRELQPVYDPEFLTWNQYAPADYKVQR